MYLHSSKCRNEKQHAFLWRQVFRSIGNQPWHKPKQSEWTIGDIILAVCNARFPASETIKHFHLESAHIVGSRGMIQMLVAEREK